MSATRKYTAHVSTHPEETRVKVRLVRGLRIATIDMGGIVLTAHLETGGTEEVAVGARARAAAHVLGASLMALYDPEGRRVL